MTLPSQYDAKLWLAILREIDGVGGRLRPRDLYPKLRVYFPEITDADLAETLTSGGNRWTNRVQWARQNLVHRGCLDASTSGYWTVTDAGRAWLMATWNGQAASYATAIKPPLIGQAPPSAKVNPAKPKPVSIKATPIVVVADPVEHLCQRLTASQRKSATPQQFEQDLADAFAYLGFAAKHVGGSREADIILTAPLGQLAYSIVVDAKSSHTGKIPDSQINWSVIANYQKNHDATYAAVVGEQFSGGQLHAFANQYGVTLITTQMLLDALRIHARAPFNLVELKDLFLASGLATDGVQALRERHRTTERHWKLIGEIIETIATFQRQASGGFALKVDQLHPVLYSKALVRGDAPGVIPTPQDVGDAVAFLASRAINVLTEVSGSGGAYQLAVQAHVARRRFHAFARHADEMAASSVTASGTSTASLTS